MTQKRKVYIGMQWDEDLMDKRFKPHYPIKDATTGQPILYPWDTRKSSAIARAKSRDDWELVETPNPEPHWVQRTIPF